MVKKQIGSKALTVSEIAEKAGVSRNLVWSYIRKHGIKAIVKEKRKYKFDASIVSEIRQKQARKQANNGENKNNDNVSKDVLEILHEQLRVKDGQIKKQAETIDFLRSEVVQARLESKKNQKLLEDARQKVEAVSASEVEKEKQEKKHWWQRLF